MADKDDSGGAELKATILEAIAAHLREHGPKKWDLVREHPDFAHVIGAAAGSAGRRKFFRWRAAVSAVPRIDVTRPHETRAAATAHHAWAVDSIDALDMGEMPVAPTPGYLMRAGAMGLNKLADVGALMNRVLEDAERVREAALEDDDQAIGGKAARDGNLLLKAGRQQLDVANSVLRLHQEMDVLTRQEHFMDGLIYIIWDELGPTHVEIVRRILGRLDDLYKTQGMSESGPKNWKKD